MAMAGREGFEAMPSPGVEQERVVLLSAANPSDLGRFKSVVGPCRIPVEIARDLHHGAGLPPRAKHASTGYRLVSGGDCPAVDASRREAAARELRGVPECKM